MSHPSLPRLNNPGGQVEFLGNESRGRPNKPFGARILARVNESPGDVLVERRWKMVATAAAATDTHAAPAPFPMTARKAATAIMSKGTSDRDIDVHFRADASARVDRCPSSITASWAFSAIRTMRSAHPGRTRSKPARSSGSGSGPERLTILWWAMRAWTAGSSPPAKTCPSRPTPG